MSGHVAGDWGTTSLRMWRIRDGGVIDRVDGPGIGALEEAPAAVLARLLRPWRDAESPDRVSLRGMAGSRTGLREAPYVACPASLDDWRSAQLRLDLDGLPIHIAAGVRLGEQDVMRGEETQIFGAIARDSSLAEGKHLLLLPGTHSKWAWVEDGTITAFRTWFTGEMFALLRDRSSLLNAGAGAGNADDREAGWVEGLARSRTAPGILGAVFEARPAQLMRGRSATWAASFLSGVLIGSEIEEGRRHAGGLPGRVTLVGAPELAERYALALADQVGDVASMDGEACALAGLELLHDD